MSTANTLSSCVSSLRSSMQLLDSSISILDSGTSDFPRLARVLQATRVGTSSLFSNFHTSPTLTLLSISNSSRSLNYKMPNLPYFPRSSPKSNPCSIALLFTSTNSSVARSL
jgi:hypothetical protein